MFWIATSFLAAGLVPGAGDAAAHEPRHQRLGVNVLFGALLVVVVGSLAGRVAVGAHQVFGLDAGFWFGHQGYEYVDLGRAWQLALFGRAGAVARVLMMRGDRFRRFGAGVADHAG